MLDIKKLTNIKDIVEVLKQLPENDRLILTLYLYERLSIEQVQMILDKIPAETNKS